MCDVGEWSAVYDSRYTFQCLYQVWFQGIFQQSGHGTFCMQVVCGYRLLFCHFTVCISNDDTSQTFFQVVDIACQTQNCHNLTCYGDIVTVFSRHTIGLSAESVYDITKLTVVHIYTTFPGDLSRVNVQSISLEDVVVDHGCQQVVSCADGMEVTGKVQVNIFHRNYLCVSAAGCSTFYTEDRS